MFFEKTDLAAVLLRQAIAIGIGDVYDRCTGGNDRFDHSGQKFDIGTAGIFSIKLHIFHETFRILYRFHTTG
ncbi:hypothetical protein D9M68_629910 [compost metagenome]